MVYLPNEIINLILSFREINPTAKLIRQSIEDYEMLRYKRNRIHYETSYYLSTLMEYKKKLNDKEFMKKLNFYEQLVPDKYEYNENDSKLYQEFRINVEINTIIDSFIIDLQHSIEYTGMVHEEYFHRLYDSKQRDTHDKWCDNYKKWYNKYRNEIYNGNKVLEKRVDGDNENDDSLERELTDCRVIFGWII